MVKQVSWWRPKEEEEWMLGEQPCLLFHIHSGFWLLSRPFLKNKHCFRVTNGILFLIFTDLH